MLKIVPFLLFFVPLCAFSADGEISADDLLLRMAGEDPPFILDVRTVEEYRSGHVEGAVNIPHDRVEKRLSELDDQRDRDVVVYCRSGRRAGVAEEVLSEAGFRVLHLQGDMKGWTAAGLPEEVSSTKRPETP